MELLWLGQCTAPQGEDGHSLATASSSPCECSHVTSRHGQQQSDHQGLVPSLQVSALVTRCSWHERGCRDRPTPSCGSAWHGGAPLITHVPPHLLALSRDPRAADVAVRGCHSCPVWGGVIYFTSHAPLHGRASHMEG